MLWDSSFGQIITSTGPIECFCWNVIAQTWEVSRNCHDSWSAQFLDPPPPCALCPTGICVRFNRTPISMHHKFAVVDGRKLITGSLNWTCTGVHDSNENVIVTEVTELVRPYVRQFTRLWLRNDPEQACVWRRTPPGSASALRILRYSDVAVKVTDQRRRVGECCRFVLIEMVLANTGTLMFLTSVSSLCPPVFFLCVWLRSLTT